MTGERKPQRPQPEAAVEHGAKAIDLGLPQTAAESERIAKRIARAGVASRRDAEKLIAEGRVKLNGQVVESPALDVEPGQKIEIDGRPLPDPDRVRLFRYHKPAGVVVSARDPQGRRTIYDHLPAGLPRLQPIGRLDINTEGLLLLTNDGELKRRMELPASGLVRRYRARAFGNLQPQVIAQLRKGISIGGINYGPMEVEEERRTGANLWLRIGLTEGKNREVRRVLEHVGLKVNRLIRIGYGPFTLGQLSKQAVAEVPQKVLFETLGIGSGSSGKTGTAKARPKPARPLSRAKAAKAKAAQPASGKKPSQRRKAGPGANKGGRHADRRR